MIAYEGIFEKPGIENLKINNDGRTKVKQITIDKSQKWQV
jgi:hypothetical protein